MTKLNVNLTYLKGEAKKLRSIVSLITAALRFNDFNILKEVELHLGTEEELIKIKADYERQIVAIQGLALGRVSNEVVDITFEIRGW